jgi:starvation-inducible DNA-binding protein
MPICSHSLSASKRAKLPRAAACFGLSARHPSRRVLRQSVTTDLHESCLNSEGRQQMNVRDAKVLLNAPLETPTDLGPNAVRDISSALNVLLADVFALYVKTKNFHWHMSGPHFRDYHLLLDEQAKQIFATTDPIAERVRKIGGTTLRSIGHVSRLQRFLDNDANFVAPPDMLAELRKNNKQLTANMRETHDLCDEHRDVATASLLENWIDEAERRAWFLFETTRR